MKKYFFILIAFIATVVVLTGCSNDQVATIHIQKSFDTTVYTNSIKTAPRYACNGHQLRQPKLVSIRTIAIPIHFAIDTTIGGSTYDKKTGLYGPIPTTSPYNEGSGAVGGSNKVGGIPAWLDDLFWLLAALILIALTALLLWWLFNKANNTSNNEVTEAAAGTKTNSVNANNSSSTVSTTTSDDVAILKQLQETGGSYNRTADGSVDIKIPEQPNLSAIFVTVIINESKKKKKEEK